LLMTVWRKSFSPATLGEKREMFSCLWRMASSNASLQYAHNRQTPQRRRDGGEGEPQSDGCEVGSGVKERRRNRDTPKKDANTVTDTKPLVSS